MQVVFKTSYDQDINILSKTGEYVRVGLVIVFMLIGLMPGDPIDIMIASNPDLTPADGARLKRLHGLDLPRSRATLETTFGTLPWRAHLLEPDEFRMPPQ